MMIDYNWSDDKRMMDSKKFVCNIEGCKHAFKSWNTLVSHQTKVHSAKKADVHNVKIALNRNTVRKFDKNESILRPAYYFH